jgi:hypothetical protein
MAAELPEAAVRAIGKGIPADKVLLPGLNLTPQEKAFVREIAEGATKRDAYITAYEPKGKSRSTTTSAWRVAERENVKQAIAVQEGIQRLRYSQNPLQIREFVVDSLQHLARTAKRDADRLAALKMLGQLADVQAFETKSVVEHRSGNDTRQRLADKLKRLTIDVDARQASDGEGEEDPTLGGEGQTGRVPGGGARSNNPHKQSAENLNPHEQFPNSTDDQEGTPYESSNITPRGVITGEEAPYEEEVGSHTGVGKKKKERPIWEDPKRWYAETMGEVPKIEWAPREDAREEVQKRLKDDEGGG